MAVSAQLEALCSLDARRAQRRRLQLGTVLAGSDQEVIVRDLSVTGFRIETSADLATGEMLEIELPRCGPTPACVVWRDDRTYGCVFPVRIPSAAISAAVLRSSMLPQFAPVEPFGTLEPPTEQLELGVRTSSLAKFVAIVGGSILLWVAIFGALTFAG